MSEQEALRERDSFESLGVAEMRENVGDRTFSLDAIKLFYDEPWCPTPGCTSMTVDAVKFPGPQWIRIDPDGVKSDLSLLHYEGRCPDCGRVRSGKVGRYSDGRLTPTTPNVWLFDCGVDQSQA